MLGRSQDVEKPESPRLRERFATRRRAACSPTLLQEAPRWRSTIMILPYRTNKIVRINILNNMKWNTSTLYIDWKEIFSPRINNAIVSLIKMLNSNAWIHMIELFSSCWYNDLSSQIMRTINSKAWNCGYTMAGNRKIKVPFKIIPSNKSFPLIILQL